MTTVTREQFLKLAGIEGDYNPYTPYSIGRRNSVIKNNHRNFATNMRNLDFLSSDELRRIRPQGFKRTPVFFKDEKGNEVEMNGYKGVVGTRDNRTYAVVSDKYKVIQHRVMIDAMSEAADECGVRIFGKTWDIGGRFTGYSWFSNIENHIYLDDKKYDPMIIGFRFYNSCLGDHVLGGEIVGVRCVCGNVGVYGEILGQVNLKHFKGVEYVSEKIIDVLKTYILRKERFNDVIHSMKEEVIDVSDGESILWGLRFDPMTIVRIISHKKTLNPEITDMRRMNLYELYNATTAYITYRSGSDTQMLTNTELSAKIGKIFSMNASELIDRGAIEKERYYESLEPVKPEPVV